MALIQCPECKNEVSDKAPACPKCGNPLGSVATVMAPTPVTFGAPSAVAAPVFVEGPKATVFQVKLGGKNFSGKLFLENGVIFAKGILRKQVLGDLSRVTKIELKAKTKFAAIYFGSEYWVTKGNAADLARFAEAVEKAAGRPLVQTVENIQTVSKGAMVLAAIVILIVFVAIFSDKEDQAGTAPSAGNSAGETAANAPEAQLPWLQTVNASCNAYDRAPNDIKRSAIFRQNEEFIGLQRVKSVRGEITGLSTNQGGSELDLTIKVGDAVFGTESMFAAIPSGSKVYQQAENLAVGQCVLFSATKLEASSMVERSKVCDPEYFAKFTDVQPCH